MTTPTAIRVVPPPLPGQTRIVSKVARYSPRELGQAWYHQIHGHASDAEQEKILEPEPDRDIQQSPHINKTWSVLSELAPQGPTGIALAFANLTTEPQPGRGGVAVSAAIRSLDSNVKDHTGRVSPLIRQALLTANRSLTQPALSAAATALFRHGIGLGNLALGVNEPRMSGPLDEWYQLYRQNPKWTSKERLESLRAYIKAFRALPDCSEAAPAYYYSGSKPASRLIYVQHPDNLPWYDLIATASFLVSALHLSSIPDCPWNAVYLGTKPLSIPDQAQTLNIQFVPEQTSLSGEPGRVVPFALLPQPGLRDSRKRMHMFMAELFGLSVETTTFSRSGVPAVPALPPQPATTTVREGLLTEEGPGGGIPSLPLESAPPSYPMGPQSDAGDDTKFLTEAVASTAVPVARAAQHSKPNPAVLAAAGLGPANASTLVSGVSSQLTPVTLSEPGARAPGTAGRGSYLAVYAGAALLIVTLLTLYVSLESLRVVKSLQAPIPSPEPMGLDRPYVSPPTSRRASDSRQPDPDRLPVPTGDKPSYGMTSEHQTDPAARGSDPKRPNPPRDKKEMPTAVSEARPAKDNKEPKEAKEPKSAGEDKPPSTPAFKAGVDYSPKKAPAPSGSK